MDKKYLKKTACERISAECVKTAYDKLLSTKSNKELSSIKFFDQSFIGFIFMQLKGVTVAVKIPVYRLHFTFIVRYYTSNIFFSFEHQIEVYSDS